MDLAAVDRQVDVVVGDEGAEAFGDPDRLDERNRFPSVTYCGDVDRPLWGLLVDRRLEVAAEDLGLALLDEGDEILGHLDDDVGVDLGERAAAVDHERVLGQVLGLVRPAGHLLDERLDRRLHVPHERRDDVVGRQLVLVDHHPEHRQVVLVGDLDDAGPLGEEHVGALGDLRLGGLGRRRRVEERVDERHVDRGVGVGLADAHDEGVDDAVDLGDRHRRDDTDRSRLGEPAGEHPGEVAGSCIQLSNTLKFGACSSQPEPKANAVSG